MRFLAITHKEAIAPAIVSFCGRKLNVLNTFFTLRAIYHMNVEPNQRRAVLSWLFVGTLLVLCGVLGVLQYRWIGEVSLAARDRLRGSLQASLDRPQPGFQFRNCRGMPGTWFRPTRRRRNSQPATSSGRETARNGQIFRAIAIAQPQLRRLNLETGAFETTGWPAEWSAIRERRRGPPGPPPEDEGPAFELPLFGMPPRGAPSTSLIFELNLPYVRDVMLPELIERHLGSDYQVEVVTRATPPSVIYQSDPAAPQPTAATADASVGLFEVQFDRIFRPEGPPAGGRGAGADPAAARAAGRCWCGTAPDRSKRWSLRPGGATSPLPPACFC